MSTTGFRVLNIGSPSFVESLLVIQNKYFNRTDQDRVGRYMREDDRRRATGSVVLQKEIIREYGTTSAAFVDIVLEYDERGKPKWGDLVYNVSHDKDIVAIAWRVPTEKLSAGTEVIGIDIMCRRKVKIETYTACLTDAERAYLATNEEKFFDFWCAKEALSKAFGLGLGIDFREMDYNPLACSIRYKMHDYDVDHFEHVEQMFPMDRYVCVIVVCKINQS